MKTITVLVYDNPQAAFHGTDTLSVEPGYILDAGEGQAYYVWNTGQHTHSIVINLEGWYAVEMESLHGCIGIDSIYMDLPGEEIPDVIMWVPNAFTPDGDGTNDTFFPVPSSDDFTDFVMVIYNRWGEELYETFDIANGWDGNKDGIRCQGDTYAWKITYRALGVPFEESQRVMAGVVLLLE